MDFKYENLNGFVKKIKLCKKKKKKCTCTHTTICYLCIIWLWINHNLSANYSSFLNGCLREKKLIIQRAKYKYSLDYFIQFQPRFPQILWDNWESKKGSPWYYQSMFTLHREQMVLNYLLVGQIESSKTSSSDPDSSSSLSKLDSSSLDSSLSSSSSK